MCKSETPWRSQKNKSDRQDIIKKGLLKAQPEQKIIMKTWSFKIEKPHLCPESICSPRTLSTYHVWEWSVSYWQRQKYWPLFSDLLLQIFCNVIHQVFLVSWKSLHIHIIDLSTVHENILYFIRSLIFINI